ncbi:MAG: sulfatase-like hydrolase/transferase, partial [Phycisphaerales bacterium]|nr:sulfatase-like hydrolase/transferase [Phycisphaerales bacterium]
MSTSSSRPVLAMLLSILFIASPAAFTAPPSIVIIMADDLGYRDVGCFGCVDFETPHIDALAASGVRCTAGYVSHPYCSPSRAGLLTGRFQQRFGHEHNPPYLEDDERIGIDPATELLPARLQAHGIATGLVGKWHVGAGPPFRPRVRGFDEFYGFLGGGHHYFRVLPDGQG